MNSDKKIFFIVLILLICAIGIICTLSYMRYISIVGGDENGTITKIVYDTIDVYYPKAKDSIVVKNVVKTFPKYVETVKDTTGVLSQALSGDSDSVAVILPITQKVYEDSTYKAYVSGYEPCLDSIFVYSKTTYIRERRPRNKWHIGVMGGYGYGFGNRRLEPYVGIGIVYSVISFQ